MEPNLRSNVVFSRTASLNVCSVIFIVTNRSISVLKESVNVDFAISVYYCRTSFFKIKLSFSGSEYIAILSKNNVRFFRFKLQVLPIKVRGHSKHYSANLIIGGKEIRASITYNYF